MSRYRYEIDDANAVKVWDLENPNELNAPFLFQPEWPNGTAWASKKEAEDWALLFIDSLQNPESEFVPGESPEQPSYPRPVSTDEGTTEIVEETA